MDLIVGHQKIGIPARRPLNFTCLDRNKDNEIRFDFEKLFSYGLKHKIVVTNQEFNIVSKNDFLFILDLLRIFRVGNSVSSMGITSQ